VSAPWTALWLTLLVQALSALTMSVPAVLAPAVAEPLGFEAQQVGLLVSVAYLFAMPSGLLCASLSPRYGPVRLSQIALWISALALLFYLSGVGWLMLVGAMLIGIGYGIPNPTAAEILSRHTPSGRRGVFFSMKQTGVPLGIAIAGVLLPWLLIGWGWRVALVIVAVGLVLLTIPMGRARGVLEAGVRPSAAEPELTPGPGAVSQNPVESDRAGMSLSSLRQLFFDRFVAPVGWVLTVPRLRRLSLSAITFAFTQIAFLNFLVSLLKLEHHLSLAAAAGMLSTSQLVSVVSRVLWGHAADRWIDPGLLLSLLGILMGLSAAALGLVPEGTSTVLLLVLSLCCAATAVAWNGVLYSELVRRVAPEEVGRVTAASQSLTFFGGVVGATIFAAVVGVAGSYSSAFVLCAALPFIAGLILLRSYRSGGLRA
jgi:MFS family permease